MWLGVTDEGGEVCKGRELHIPHLHEWQRACLQMGNGEGGGWGGVRGVMLFL